MRRNEFDVESQPIRNLFNNPAMESTESAHNTVIRSNFLTNPGNRNTATNPTVFRTNMMTNPSMELAGPETITVRENLLPNPGVERDSGTVWLRTNFSTNPRGTGNFQAYANAAITQDTVDITDHPEGIDKARRITYSTGSNPGVALLSATEPGTTYTVSAWVYHESIMSTPGQPGFAQAGITSSGHDFVLNEWKRYSWTYTPATSTNLLGYRVGGQTGTGTGSFLITGVLVEKTAELRPFFDWVMTPPADFTYTRTASGYTDMYAKAPANLGANTSATRVWQSSDYAYTGAKSLRCESLHATQTGNGISLHITGLPIGTYTFSAYVLMPTLYGSGLVAAARGAGDETLYRGQSTNVTGSWKRIHLTFQVTAVGQTWMYILATGASTAPIGAFFYADAFMLERATTPGPYFDAENPRQNLVSNPNFATGIQGWSRAGLDNALISRDTSVSFYGAASLRVETNGISTNQGAYTSTRQSVKTNREYSVSVWVKGEQGKRILLEYAELDAAVVDVPSRSRVWYTLASSDWERIDITRTMSDQAVTSQVLVRMPDAAPHTFWIGAVLVEEGDLRSDFYEATGDFSYKWSGSANSSSSLQTALSVPDISSNNMLAFYQSKHKTRPGSVGSYSLYGYGSGPAQQTWCGPTVYGTVIGKQYTVSAWVYLMPDSVNIEVQVSGIPADVATGIAATRGQWIRLYQKFTATGTSHILRFRSRGDGVIHYFIDDILVEEGTFIHDYFDGSTPAGDGLTRSWTGKSNASTSTESGYMVVGMHSNISLSNNPNGRQWAYQVREDGETFSRWVSPAGSGDTRWRVAALGHRAMDISKIKQGQTYTLYLKYRTRGWITTQSKVAIQNADSSNPVLSGDGTPVILLNSPEWTIFRRAFTALRDANDESQIYIQLPSTPSEREVGVIDISQAAIFDGKYLHDYFDGDTASTDPDYSFHWRFGANNSISTMQGAAVIGQSLTLSHGAAVSSGRWKWSGSKSIRIIAQDFDNSDSFVDISRMVDPASLKPNTTYTISATRYQEAPLTGTLLGGQRSFRVHLGGEEKWTDGGIYQNIAGPQHLRATFTTGASVSETYRYIRLVHGGRAGSGDVWYDNICLTEGVTKGQYVSGDLREARWLGAAHASESVGYPESLESLAGTPLFVYQSTGTFKLDSTLIGSRDPRTFYTLAYTEKLPTGRLDALLVYGQDNLGDGTPNRTLTFRSQSTPPANENVMLIRRTNGSGPSMTGVPAPGYSITIGGLTPEGFLFAGRYGVDNLIIDNQLMELPHEAIRLEGNNDMHRHMAVYCFRGMHDAYTRTAVSRALAVRHGISGIL